MASGLTFITTVRMRQHRQQTTQRMTAPRHRTPNVASYRHIMKVSPGQAAPNSHDETLSVARLPSAAGSGNNQPAIFVKLREQYGLRYGDELITTHYVYEHQRRSITTISSQLEAPDFVTWAYCEDAPAQRQCFAYGNRPTRRQRTEVRPFAAQRHTQPLRQPATAARRRQPSSEAVCIR